MRKSLTLTSSDVMLGRRRSIPDKRVLGMKTDRPNKGNSEVSENAGSGGWIQGQSWSTLGSRIYMVIQWLHPRRLVTLLASAIGLIKRIALVIVHGRRGRRARLIAWFSDQLRRSGGCAAAQWAASEPCDLRAVWREGSLLCALVNALAPGACPDHPENDLAIAQEAVTRQWALPPAFTNDELLQVTFSSHFERRLLRYLSAIQQASERLPGTQDGPTSDSASRVGSLMTSEGHTSPACVARGMGLFTATQYRRASFLIYLLDADPSDVFVVIQTQRDFGFARVGLQGCVLPSRYSNIPITISQDTGNGTRVTFTPQSYGQHELVILRKGVHIPGSPFCIPVEKANGSENVEKESVQSPVRRKKVRVLLRTVDFVTEKMVLTEDGKLKKIPQNFLDEHLKAIKEGKSRRKPEIYIYVSEEGSTMHQVWGSSPGCSDVDSEQEEDSKNAMHSSLQQLSGSFNIEPRHDLTRAKCLHRQSNLDSAVKRGKQFHDTRTRLVKGTEFQSRCKKIISMCKFVLDTSRKRHGLRMLSAVRKIIDGRPIRMSGEVELMLKKLAESVQPTELELVADGKPDALALDASKELPESDTDQSLSPSPLGGEGGRLSEVAVHTQIKCFEDKLAYCNEYIESVLQQNTVILENPDEMGPPNQDINSDIQNDFGSALIGVSITQQPIESELSRPIVTNLFELDDTSPQSQRENDAQTNSLKVTSNVTPDQIESGESSPRFENNFAGFWPASSSSPSSMSETSTEAAAAKFPDLDAFLSGQFTKYMASETQFHLWPSDIAFGDVQDTICAMEDDEMVDFDSVISAPNLEEALVKLEQGLRMKSTLKRDSEVNSQCEATAGFSGNGDKGASTESVDWAVKENEKIYSTRMSTTGANQNEGSKICLGDDQVEQHCLQNRLPDNIEFIVNSPDPESDPGEDLDPEDPDEVSSNPSPQAGDPNVEGWDSAYLSIDDLKGSPENRLANNSTTSSNSIGNASREKERAFWPDNSNMAITGFMGPAEKEIWGFEEEQDDDNESSNGVPLYPRVLTPLTNMMSLILEEDEEKIITCSVGVEECIVNKSDTNVNEERNHYPQNELVIEMQNNVNDPETEPFSPSDPDQDSVGNEAVDMPADHNFDDTSLRKVVSSFEISFDGLLLENLDSELDDTLDEDVSVAFDALIAEQLDLFDQGSDLDSALAEALQVTSLHDKITCDVLSLQQEATKRLEQEVTPLAVNPESTEFPAQQEHTGFQVQQASDELTVQQETRESTVQQESSGLPVHNESSGLPVQQEFTGFPVQQESTGSPVQQESRKSQAQQEDRGPPVQKKRVELSVQLERTGLPVQQESTGMPEQQENTGAPVQQECTGSPVLQESTGLPVQEEISFLPVLKDITKLPVQLRKEFTVQVSGDVVDTEIPEQCANVELTALAIELPVVSYCKDSDQSKEKKLINTSCCSIENVAPGIDEEVDEESVECNLKMYASNTCLEAATLAVKVEANCHGATTTKHEAISDETITTKEFPSEFSCKAYENNAESKTTNMGEQKEVESASLTIDVTEIIDVPAGESRQGPIDICGDKTANNDLVKNNNVNISATNLRSKANFSDQFTTKEYVSFKKEYWDRKVQMLDLVSKHSQPHSAETSYELSNKPTNTAHNQPKGFNLPLSSAEGTLTYSTEHPDAMVTSKIDPEKLELPRSPSLYRARRVLVSEDYDDGCILKSKTNSNLQKPQDEDDQKESGSVRGLSQIKEAEVMKTDNLPKGTRQSTEAEVDIQVCSSPKRPRPISNEGRHTENLARMSRLRNDAEVTAVGNGLQRDIPFRRDSRVRKDSPEEMKARFQTAKEFFQTLEKGNSKLSRGLSSESDDSRWETVAAGWRGPLGGSERVRVPRRCHIKDIF